MAQMYPSTINQDKLATEVLSCSAAGHKKYSLSQEQNL